MEDSTETKDRAAHFEAFLKSLGMRKTQERFAILEAVESMDGHFDVAALYSCMEQRAYHVSRSTLYSTIDLLCRSGILHCHRFDSMESTYELADSSHIHLICNVCGKVEERVIDNAADFKLPVELGDFKPTRFAIEIFGICDECRDADTNSLNNEQL